MEAHVLGKVTRRLIPYLFILYVVAFLDRVNLGYAALKMNADLSLSDAVFGLAAGIFFIGYFIFEVPSNLLLHRLGARVWIARILVSWGIIAMLTAFVQNAGQLYLARFLLGVAEAGFFPGVILYLTYWLPMREQARAVALFMTAVAVSNLIGAPLSTWILDHVHALGLSGWRWLFILEGLPAVILGVATLYVLADRPQQAKWLTEEEKAWLEQELARDHQSSRMASLREGLAAPKVWYFALLYFLAVMGLYGTGFWLPTIIKGMLESYVAKPTNTQVGLLLVIPYAAAVIAMVYWGRRSDRLGERRLHTALALALAGVGMFLAGLLFQNGILSFLAIVLSVMGIYGVFGPFWSFVNLFLTGTAAAAGQRVLGWSTRSAIWRDLLAPM